MVDRDTIARLHKPVYTCKQFSSYDRNSTEPGSPTWWANWDRSYFVRIEENNGRKEHVMMDAKGPGAVVRIWATWHGPGGGQFSNGTLRFYFDGNPKPAIEGPTEDLISKGLLVAEPLSEGVSPQTAYKHRGHNLYLPIPSNYQPFKLFRAHNTAASPSAPATIKWPLTKNGSVFNQLFPGRADSYCCCFLW